jgi:hypothetical protein
MTRIIPSPGKGRGHLGYHAFRNVDGTPYGSFEVFACPDHKVGKHKYWWHACFPGRLPDGEPIGPFDTAKEAFRDAMEGGQ